MVFEINDGSSFGLQNNLKSANSLTNRAFQRISSGLRINSAADDASRLAQSTRLTSQIQGLSQAGRNANDAISLAQTADGALSGVTEGLQRIRELAIQSANGTNSAQDRSALQAEANQIAQQLQDISNDTTFNGVNLFQGGSSLDFQIGSEANQTVNVSIADPLESLGSIDLSTADGAQAAIESVDAAIAEVSTTRADLGAVQNRFRSAITNIETTKEGLAAANSRIADADIAAEVSNLVKSQILEQASLASLSQSNANKSGVLQLLTQTSNK